MKFNNRNVFIHESAIIGQNVKIGDGTTINANVVIGDYSIIADGCTIGEPTNAYYSAIDTYINPPTVIGQNALIRSNTILYADSVFGTNFQTGHSVIIREKTIIGNNCVVGSNNDIQGLCEIGDYCRFQSFVNIGQFSKIGSYVFIFPYVVLTNDLTPPCEKVYGVIVEDYAVISSSSVVLGGKKIGKNSLVGAQSLVNIDVPEDSFVSGNPIKNYGKLSKMPFFSKGKRHYPWAFSFKRAMPWEEEGYAIWRANNKE